MTKPREAHCASGQAAKRKHHERRGERQGRGQGRWTEKHSGDARGEEFVDSRKWGALLPQEARSEFDRETAGAAADGRSVASGDQ